MIQKRHGGRDQLGLIEAAVKRLATMRRNCWCEAKIKGGVTTNEINATPAKPQGRAQS
jgi:hypothetical protein